MKGGIIFKNFYMKYNSDTEFVLKNLNIVIEPTEKVILINDSSTFIKI